MQHVVVRQVVVRQIGARQIGARRGGDVGHGVRLAGRGHYAAALMPLQLVLRRAGRFGDLSYGMYLYAFPVQQVILGARPDFGYPILACMVLTVPLAVLSWHLVERPALLLGVRLRARAGVRDPAPQHALAAEQRT